MYAWCGPEVVVPPLWLLADVEPRADGVDVGEARRTVVVPNQQLFWDLLVVVQAYDRMHGRVVATREALWVEAADVPTAASTSRALSSSQCSSGKSTTAISA